MEIRKLISKFLTNVFEKKYSEADKSLQQVVESKTKEKIEKVAKSKKQPKKGSKNQKPDFLDVDGDGDKNEPWKKAKKDAKGKKVSKKGKK
jgi:spore germination cell wall hydrolase CwlJ-like protein